MTDPAPPLGEEPPRNERELKLWDMRDVSRDTGEPRRMIVEHVVSANYADYWRRSAEQAKREVQRLQDLHLERTKLTTRVIGERDSARALLREAISRVRHTPECRRYMEGMAVVCICESEELHARVAAALGEKP